ncbi:hypothetical protein VJJ74_07845, partial [Parvimonas micra]|uniref:hypothetical protein n=1 Tax=Parvimonas micra TaxID=33033 RepID=UPI002B469B76
DHEANGQAEDRIHWDIRVTPHPVNIWYVKHTNSYDVDIIDKMASGADNVHLLMHAATVDVFR